MALTSFLNNTCTITKQVKTITGGEEIITNTPVYTSIPCHFYSVSARLKDENALNTDTSNVKVIVEQDKTLIRAEMIITIIDSDLGTIGEYIIESVKMNRLISGTNDSIQLKLKAIK